jgi:hypothetical protein
MEWDPAAEPAAPALLAEYPILITTVFFSGLVFRVFVFIPCDTSLRSMNEFLGHIPLCQSSAY